MFESVVAFLLFMALPCVAVIVYDTYKGGQSETREIIAYIFFGMWALGAIGNFILIVYERTIL